MSEQNGNASKVLPGVEIYIGAEREKHILKFSLRSLMELHRITGKNPLTGELFANIAPAEIATLLWAGTLHEKHGLSVEDFADKVQLEDMNEISMKLLEAYSQATPAEKKTGTDEIEVHKAAADPSDLPTG